MTRLGLTPRMRDCFDAIHDHLLRHSVAPTYEELRVALDVRSKSVVCRLLIGLRERGWITYFDNRARSIAIVGAESQPGYQLAPKVEAALLAHCRRYNEADPAAVISDAVALFLDEAGGRIAA